MLKHENDPTFINPFIIFVVLVTVVQKLDKGNIKYIMLENIENCNDVLSLFRLAYYVYVKRKKDTNNVGNIELRNIVTKMAKVCYMPFDIRYQHPDILMWKGLRRFLIYLHTTGADMLLESDDELKTK